MINQLTILDVYQFHQHLQSLEIDEKDTLMMSRGIILLPQFLVLCNGGGVYLVLEEINKTSCKLHAYVSKDSRGRHFIKALKEFQAWVQTNTSYTEVFFYLTDDSIHAEVFLRQYNVTECESTELYPVYRFDLSQGIERGGK